jgi:sugar O-acyltransferase (sialic acid O-acetyltransferase NeuD family)
VNDIGQPLIIYGNSQMAEVAFARFSLDPAYTVRGFTVDAALLDKPSLFGLPVVPFEDVQRQFPPAAVLMHVAVGPVRACRIRADRFESARRLGYRFAGHVEAGAFVDPSARLGANCWIGHGAYVGPYAKLGDQVTLATHAVVSHHCVVEEHCFLSLGCAISGSVRIGARVFIGANATIRDRVVLGEGSIVGAGVTIRHDTAPGSVFAAPEPVALSIGADQVRL